MRVLYSILEVFPDSSNSQIPFQYVNKSRSAQVMVQNQSRKDGDHDCRRPGQVGTLTHPHSPELTLRPTSPVRHKYTIRATLKTPHLSPLAPQPISSLDVATTRSDTPSVPPMELRFKGTPYPGP